MPGAGFRHSRVHFRRGFVEDGLAKKVVVIGAPGLGPADVTTIPYKNAPKDIYPLTRTQRVSRATGQRLIPELA